MLAASGQHGCKHGAGNYFKYLGTKSAKAMMMLSKGNVWVTGVQGICEIQRCVKSINHELQPVLEGSVLLRQISRSCILYVHNGSEKVLTKSVTRCHRSEVVMVEVTEA